jgi:hypothetical protein
VKQRIEPMLYDNIMLYASVNQNKKIKEIMYRYYYNKNKPFNYAYHKLYGSIINVRFYSSLKARGSVNYKLFTIIKERADYTRNKINVV